MKPYLQEKIMILLDSSSEYVFSLRTCPLKLDSAVVTYACSLMEFVRGYRITLTTYGPFNFIASVVHMESGLELFSDSMVMADLNRDVSPAPLFFGTFSDFLSTWSLAFKEANDWRINFLRYDYFSYDVHAENFSPDKVGILG